tara:strand:+ start:1215 stop:1868 length:654 start_codon:yes stop_codon:yes gene_type:complete
MHKIVFIVILLSFTFIKDVVTSEIVLQKNNIIITNNDLENYKRLHNDFYGNIIGNSPAIKKLYLTLKIINLQMDINPKFDEITKKIMSEDLKKYKDTYSQYILEFFLRYEILKNDYVNNYINKNNLKELDKILIVEINFYNDNKCEMKKKSTKFKNLTQNQKILIMSNLNSKTISMKDNTYVCLSQKNTNEINNAINNIISNKGYEEFLKYVYKNIK